MLPILEFVSRGNLWDFLHNKKRKEQIKYKLFHSIAKDTAMGIAYLHKVNIIHREYLLESAMPQTHTRSDRESGIGYMCLFLCLC